MPQQVSSSQSNVVDLTFDSSDDESSDFRNDASTIKTFHDSAHMDKATNSKAVFENSADSGKPQFSINGNDCHDTDLPPEERASLRRFFRSEAANESRVRQSVGVNEVHTNVQTSPQERSILRRFFSQRNPVGEVVMQKGIDSFEGKLEGTSHVNSQEGSHDCDWNQSRSNCGLNFMRSSGSSESSEALQMQRELKREQVDKSVHANTLSTRSNLETQETGSTQEVRRKERNGSDADSVDSKGSRTRNKYAQSDGFDSMGEVMPELEQKLKKGDNPTLKRNAKLISPGIDCIDLLDSSDSGDDESQVESSRESLPRESSSSSTQQESEHSSSSSNASANHGLETSKGVQNTTSYSAQISRGKKEKEISHASNENKDTKEVTYIELSDSESEEGGGGDDEENDSESDDSDGELEIVGVFNPVKLSLQQKLTRASEQRQRKIMENLQAGSTGLKIQKMQQRQREALRNFEEKKKLMEEQKTKPIKLPSSFKRRRVTDHDKAEIPLRPFQHYNHPSSPSRRFTMYANTDPNPTEAFSHYSSNPATTYANINTYPQHGEEVNHDHHHHRFNRKKDYGYFDTNENLIQEQERLFRASANRVRAQEEAKREHLIRSEGVVFFTQPLSNLKDLPPHHWKWSCPYSRLGLPPHSNYSLVKRHYRKLCLLYHPDKAKLKDAPDRFQGIKEAYETISKSVERRTKMS